MILFSVVHCIYKGLRTKKELLFFLNIAVPLYIGWGDGSVHIQTGPTWQQCNFGDSYYHSSCNDCKIALASLSVKHQGIICVSCRV